MHTLLKLEEIGLFLLCIFLFSLLDFVWWWFPALLLLPDIGMVGYIWGARVGAFTYNFLHHRLLASAVAIYALASGNAYGQLAAVILFAHISMDRVFGYGLKHRESFQMTHLGKIGK